MTNLSTMRAVVLEEYNSPLRLTAMARPKAGAGQALVRVMASGVNPLDTKIRTGNGGHARQTPPAVLGMDLAGVVEEIGAEVPLLTGKGRGHHGEIMREATKLVDAGSLTPLVDGRLGGSSIR